MADISELIKLSYKKETLKKLVFSKPISAGANKISARLCAHRGKKLLAAEFSLPGNTVSHKNLTDNTLDAFLTEYIPLYAQINLITDLGDAEYKISKSGPIVLGADKLERRHLGNAPAFEKTLESLMRDKERMLSGTEPFLISLGVSDATGRVHDKKQAKFRQINKFLEYLDEIYPSLSESSDLLVYDLCCGKSYLSFAVYHYLTVIKQRKVYMLGIDLKKDVMDFCNAKARELGFTGMNFICDDITNTPKDKAPDLVISLHACDIATDIVLDTAVKLGAKVILSTPCCHRELSERINSPELKFVTKYPKLKRSLCDSLTDALRLERLSTLGYDASATELVDPDDTPKNTLIRAIKRKNSARGDINAYNSLVRFLLGEGADAYIGIIEENYE